MAWADTTLYTAEDLTSHAIAPEFANDFSNQDSYYLHEDVKEFIKYDLFRKVPELNNDMDILDNFGMLHHAALFYNKLIVYKNLYPRGEAINQKIEETRAEYDEALEDAIDYIRNELNEDGGGVVLAR